MARQVRYGITSARGDFLTEVCLGVPTFDGRVGNDGMKFDTQEDAEAIAGEFPDSTVVQLEE